MPSSPMGPPPSSLTSSKPKKAPSITPRRFTRFFTPQSIVLAESSSSRTGNGNGNGNGRSARQLRDITRNAVNRKTLDSNPATQFSGFQDIDHETPRKRRKVLPTPESSPVQPLSSPCRPSTAALPSQIYHHDLDSCSYLSEDDDDDDDDLDLKPCPPPIRRVRQTGPTSRLLHRTFGGSRAIARGGSHRDHCASWQSQTADFYTRPQDSHTFRGTALPFCLTPCHSNSLIAIGEEEGAIRLVDTANAANASFATPYVSFKPHHNAVMDIAFSSDDFLFATASGDQTAKIIDMRTQQTRFIMQGHTSSVKQVRFQPDNDMIVATSGRDGTVKIWDLRCSGMEAPVADFTVAFEPGNDLLAPPPSHHSIKYATEVGWLTGAHARFATNSTIPDRIPSNPRELFASSRTNSSNAAVTRRTDISITAFSFLPADRSHIFMTACEANASIKLWDMRAATTARYSKDKLAIPVSSTPSPAAHARNRHFGINSLVLNSEGSRTYALCRDSTVYAYSTNHLILGTAPEFKNNSRYTRPEAKTGVGALYGFRHPQFQATSFYVKAAIRPARGDKSEMLAVGSRDGSPILFPTDESLLNKPSPNHHEDVRNQYRSDDLDEDDIGLPSLRSLRQSRSPMLSTLPPLGAKSQDDCDIPIYEQGTALVRGHTSEVTSLTWTHDGDLVTLGDDFVARCWRENQSTASDLRRGGEGEGRRWGCGWAEMSPEWDEDDG